VGGIPALIPKLIVRPGTFGAHRVVICCETARTTENVIAVHGPFAVYRRRLSGPGI